MDIKTFGGRDQGSTYYVVADKLGDNKDIHAALRIGAKSIGPTVAMIGVTLRVAYDGRYAPDYDATKAKQFENVNPLLRVVSFTDFINQGEGRVSTYLQYALVAPFDQTFEEIPKGLDPTEPIFDALKIIGVRVTSDRKESLRRKFAEVILEQVNAANKAVQEVFGEVLSKKMSGVLKAYTGTPFNIIEDKALLLRGPQEDLAPIEFPVGTAKVAKGNNVIPLGANPSVH